MVEGSLLNLPEFEPPSSPPFEPGKSPFRVAAVVYKNLFAFIEAHVSGGLAAVRRDLPAELGDYLTGPRDVFAKYDAIPLPYVNSAVARRRGVSFEDQLRDANTWSEKRHGALYRAVLAVLSAQSVALALPRATAIAQHYGRTTTRVAGERNVRGERSGVPRTLVRWTGFSSARYLVRALARAGAIEPQVEYGAPFKDGVVEGETTYAIPFSVSWQS